MNVELMKRVRESVANPNNCLNLDRFDTCIVKHVFDVAGDSYTSSPPGDLTLHTAHILDLTFGETSGLILSSRFGIFGTGLRDSNIGTEEHRRIALARIDGLLAKYGTPATPEPEPAPAPEPEPESVGAL